MKLNIFFTSIFCFQWGTNKGLMLRIRQGGDKTTKETGAKYKKSVGGGQSWRNIFHLGQPLTRSKPGQGQELRGSHREINIDDAILPENKPLNYRPRPRSEINLSYSIQVSKYCRDYHWRLI